MISLGYYLRVVAAVWMRPAPQQATTPTAGGSPPVLAGGAPEADRAPVELLFVAVGFAVLTLAAGIVPPAAVRPGPRCGPVAPRPVLVGIGQPQTNGG